MTAAHWALTLLFVGAFAAGAILGRMTGPRRPSTGAGADPAAPGGDTGSGTDVAPTGGGGRIVPRLRK